MKPVRTISWITAARKDFQSFPAAVQTEALRALTIAAAGQKADIAKPLKGIADGILEVVLRHRIDAFRVVYAIQIGEDLWVVHAFQKKSKSGIELIRARIKRLKELLS